MLNFVRYTCVFYIYNFHANNSESYRRVILYQSIISSLIIDHYVLTYLQTNPAFIPIPESQDLTQPYPQLSL